MARDITRFIMSWIFGILGIILLVFILNILSFMIVNTFISDITSFVNNNLLIIIGISFLFFLGSLFSHFGFPVNLAMPIFDGFGGALFVFFIIKLISLIDTYILTGIGSLLSAYSRIISIIVFFLIIIFGYLSVLQHEKRRSIIRKHRM